MPASRPRRPTAVASTSRCGRSTSSSPALFLLVSLPLSVPIALLVLATSGTPLFYRGERVGVHGAVFTMLKFRTLRPDAEQRLGPYLGDELVARTRPSTPGSAAGSARRSSTRSRSS